MKRYLLTLLVAVASCGGLSQPVYAATTSHSVHASAIHADSLRTIHATPAANSVLSVVLSPVSSPTRSNESRSKLIVTLMAVALIGSIKTVASDKDTRFSADSVRQYLNRLVGDFYYFLLNGVMSTTVATLPACATATTTTKAKTTNATVLQCAGVATALAATDNYWTLTGAVLAVSSFRRYLLLSNAAGTASVQASSDASTAAGCVFSTLPAAGVAIVGTLTIATDGTHTFTPATTALSATGITSTFIDSYDDAVFQSAQVTP